MSLIQAILLGLVQGATEFIPVSSSAHLVLIPFLFKWQSDPEISFAFDVLVHWGTLLAAVFYFRKDLKTYFLAFFAGLKKGKPFESDDSRLAWLLILGTIPAALVGYLFKDFFEAIFTKPLPAALFLFVTAGLLTWSEKTSDKTKTLSQIKFKNALVIGLAQAVAIFPGISRSGSTIAAGLWCGLNRVAAARFSFLLSVPIILGAGTLPLQDLVEKDLLMPNLALLLAGFISAALSGYLTIGFLMKYLQTRRLYIFAIYCLFFAVLNLMVIIFR